MVFDINVLISALISDGKPRTLLRKVVSKELTMITSDLFLNELNIVIQRPKFKVNAEQINRNIQALTHLAERVNVVSKFNIVERDVKDNMFLEMAWDGEADFIVSGDATYYR